MSDTISCHPASSRTSYLSSEMNVPVPVVCRRSGRGSGVQAARSGGVFLYGVHRRFSRGPARRAPVARRHWKLGPPQAGPDTAVQSPLSRPDSATLATGVGTEWPPVGQCAGKKAAAIQQHGDPRRSYRSDPKFFYCARHAKSRMALVFSPPLLTSYCDLRSAVPSVVIENRWWSL